MHPHNLYIHVPYCASKCNYCAFYSVCAPDWSAYERAIMRDIKSWSMRLGCIKVPTIFFGGGTPSLMPTDMFSRIMTQIRESFDVANDAEITIESNPGTLDGTRLHEFISAGVNRLSIGVQSFDDDVLKFFGRKHSARDARDLLDAAHRAGIRVSGDFIYGIPGQTVDDILDMCDEVLESGLMHASCYELSIDANTPFAKMNLELPDNDTMAEMYNAIATSLAPNLLRYEVSNYSAPGFECKHNTNIWSGDAYLGIGPAAAGRVLIDGQWYEQGYTQSVTEWLNGNGKFFHPIDDKTRGIEKIMTGLRTARGVALSGDVKEIIDWEYIKKNPELFTNSGMYLSLSPRGQLLLDNLLLNLIV